MDIVRKQTGENTRAVHLPPPLRRAAAPRHAGVPDRVRSRSARAEEYAAVLNDEVPGYTYSRIDNPTADAFAARGGRAGGR